MSVYHQVGHDSINLVNDEQLNQYQGMVCSPVNYVEEKVVNHIQALPKSFSSILDPQLYFPKTEKEKLQTWDYFPSDFESADQSSSNWWQDLNKILIETCKRIGCTHICSPCVVPSRFTNDYYKFYVDIGNHLNEVAQTSDIDFFQTAIIEYSSIKEEGEAESIASVLSQTEGNSIYLIINTNIEPRKELSDSDSIAGIMKLVRLLTDSGIQVFVAFCSSDFLLWKYAGATSFATGKFFNLRRFTSSRFDEPTGGGGQLPYWFEKSLMAYIREGDLETLNDEGLLHPDYAKNPFSVAILNQLKNDPGNAWLGLSWKNYLYAFAELEKELDNEERIRGILQDAEKSWLYLDNNDVLMEEQRNDGSWIRKWRIAINKFNKAI
jgi:hypothetical protein